MKSETIGNSKIVQSYFAIFTTPLLVNRREIIFFSHSVTIKYAAKSYYVIHSMKNSSQRKRYISYSIFAFSLITVFGVYGFKRLKSNWTSDCFCANISESVLPSVSLRLENASAWAKGSYHSIKWKKSCNVLEVILSVESLEGKRLQEETFSPCDSEYLFQVPQNSPPRLKITLTARDQKHTHASIAVGYVTTAAGDATKYEWTRITNHAAFEQRDGAIPAVINNRMFLYGGWNPFHKDQTNNEMWSSSNGKDWQFLGNAPWERRHCSGRAMFKNKFWIIGGDCNQGHYQNDIWTTEDGIHWSKILDSIPWIPRVNFGVQVFNDKIWLLGGERVNITIAEDEQAFNDVYYSEDGIHWTKSEAPLPSGRAHIGKFTATDKLFLIGGTEYHNKNAVSDVWNSEDGKTWSLVLKTPPWKKLCYSNFIEFDNKLWIMGGNGPAGNTNDVWYTSDGYNWYKMNDVPWEPRHACSLFNMNGSVFLTAGFLLNDVWQLRKI